MSSFIDRTPRYEVGGTRDVSELTFMAVSKPLLDTPETFRPRLPQKESEVPLKRYQDSFKHPATSTTCLRSSKESTATSSTSSGAGIKSAEKLSNLPNDAPCTGSLAVIRTLNNCPWCLDEQIRAAQESTVYRPTTVPLHGCGVKPSSKNGEKTSHPIYSILCKVSAVFVFLLVIAFAAVAIYFEMKHRKAENRALNKL